MEREKRQLVKEYDTLSMRVAIKQMDYEEVDERVKEANERADRIEAYTKLKAILWWIWRRRQRSWREKQRLRRWFMIWREVPVAMKT